jgi:hypothetical protein
MRKKWLTAIFILLAARSFSSAAKDDSPDPSDYSVVAREAATAPKIDGRLNDAFWSGAEALDNFTQYEPREGGVPSEKTVAYIGYDRNNLYIGVRCFDSDPKAVRACLTERDKVFGDDEVTIYLDTFNDKKRAFAFLVNPCGVQSDGVYNEIRRRHRGGGGGGGGGSGGFSRIDKNWDTFFHSAAIMDDEGYSVELSIPFKSIRFPESAAQTWGLQIQRNIRRKNEEIYWYPRSRNVNGFLVQTGQLHIQGELEKGKNFEVMPVVTGLKQRGNAIDPEAGLNLKYGITSNLTADLTFNPDFSQIEADMPQIDVNQRYALYYPEKRPFFLEGKDIFDTPIELVYTRTITTPMGGGKLTGKVGKTTLGFLSAYDQAPTDIDIPGAREEQEWPRGFVNIFRLKQDIYQESYIGAIFTDKETGSDWNSITNNHNRVGGVDGHFKLGRFNRFAFQIVGSSSKVEEQETGLVPAMQFDLSHSSRRVSLSASYTHLPPDFEAGVGYIRRKDIRQFRTRVGYNILPMNDVVVDIRPSLEYRRAYDFDNILTDEEIQLGWFVSGWRGTYMFGGYSYEMERYEGIDFKRKGLRLRVGSDPLAWLGGGVSFSIGDGIYYDENPYLGYKISYGTMLTLRPMTNLRIFYSFRNDTFWRERRGERVYKINILSQRVTYQLSRHLSLRVITDYNDYDGDLYNSFLFSYRLNPGTVFYLGMDDNRLKDDSGIFRNDGTFYFVKFSYWWRI